MGDHASKALAEPPCRESLEHTMLDQNAVGPSDYSILSRSWAALERSEGRRPTVSHSVRGESPRKVFETNG
jgi:hypothetical protein